MTNTAIDEPIRPTANPRPARNAAAPSIAGAILTRPQQSRLPATAVAERRSGLAILTTAVCASLALPLLSPYRADELATDPMQPPSMTHPFGTDTLGRDLLTRVFVALGVDIGIAAVTVVICVLAGSVIGIVIGLCPNVIRELLLRVIDAMLAIPYMIVVLGIVALSINHKLIPFLTPSIGAVITALIVTGWASYARLTALQTQVICQRESVQAARLLGYGPVRILARHVLPEALRPCVSLGASHAVLSVAIIASLAFLGAGVQAPTPELGVLMHEGTEVLTAAWWIAVFPGLAVLVVGLGFVLVADSFDPTGTR